MFAGFEGQWLSENHYWPYSASSEALYAIVVNYRVVFLTGPTQKSSKYGTGPPQQEKMTKYTGPTQDLLTQKSSKYGTGTPQQEKMTKYTGPT